MKIKYEKHYGEQCHNCGCSKSTISGKRYVKSYSIEMPGRTIDVKGLFCSFVCLKKHDHKIALKELQSRLYR
jgi:hypothetical protein